MKSKYNLSTIARSLLNEQSSVGGLKLNKKNKFYHLTSKKNLDSFLKKGISSSTQSQDASKSQGGGFYVWDTEKSAITWKNATPGNLGDLLLEFELTFSPKYFEIDTELMTFNPESSKRESGFLLYWNTFLDVLKKFRNLNFYYIEDITDSPISLEKISVDNIDSFYVKAVKGRHDYMFIVSSDDISADDLDIETEGDTVDFLVNVISKNKNIGYFKLYPLSMYQYDLTKSMESLKKFKIQEKFNEELILHSRAFRYKGPVEYPIRWKIMDENGSWSNWQQQKEK